MREKKYTSSTCSGGHWTFQHMFEWLGKIIFIVKYFSEKYIIINWYIGQFKIDEKSAECVQRGAAWQNIKIPKLEKLKTKKKKPTKKNGKSLCWSWIYFKLYFIDLGYAIKSKISLTVEADRTLHRENRAKYQLHSFMVCTESFFQINSRDKFRSIWFPFGRTLIRFSPD